MIRAEPDVTEAFLTDWVWAFAVLLYPEESENMAESQIIQTSKRTDNPRIIIDFFRNSRCVIGKTPFVLCLFYILNKNPTPYINTDIC